MLHVYSAGVVAITALVASVSIPQAPEQRVSLCGSVDSPHARGFIAAAHNLATNPRHAALREAIGIPNTRADQIVFVQTDSLCARAAAVVNRDRGHAGTGEQRVYLLRVGALYWVEDPTYMAGEYIRGLVLDSTITHILGRPGR